MTLTLNGQSYGIDTDITSHGLPLNTWATAVPDCPACGYPLLHDDATVQTSRAPVTPRYAQPALVVCGECGWQQAVQS